MIPDGMRAVSVRVNDVIGVAGYVLPGTASTSWSTVSPTEQHTDITSKMILTNVQVLTAGTRIERDVEQDKPISVSVVTLLVDPDAGGTADARQHGRQDSARAAQPARQGHASTPGIRQAALLGATPLSRPSASRDRASPRHPSPLRPRPPPRRRNRLRPSRSSEATNARRKSCARSSTMETKREGGRMTGLNRAGIGILVVAVSARASTPLKPVAPGPAAVGTDAEPNATTLPADHRTFDRRRHRLANHARVADERGHRRRDGDVAEPAARARQDARHDLHVRLEPRRCASQVRGVGAARHDAAHRADEAAFAGRAD